VRSEPPCQLRHIEHLEIPVRDGTKLAARLWHPVDADARPVPAVLEYIPYRNRDATRWRDALHHPYVAGHGYACVRVDLRGSGDSEGVLTDEYLEVELADGEDVIDWIAEQPWCDGSVGMMGISWGGFNGLQLAARRPARLGAIITVASTDDRYADDVHYMGGCLLGDNLSWASTMFAYNSLPPDPELVVDWRDRWFERLEGSGLWLATWLEHQHRDDYWRHGSVAEDHGAIEVPVMAVSGWADGYTNAVFRLLEHLDVPRQGLVGPWSHKYPHMGEPGPAIGWLQECVRWWDRWLKGIDNGIDEEPMLRAWMQDSEAPFTSYDERPGRWVSEPSWPSPNIERREYRVIQARLVPADEVGPARRVTDKAGLVVHSPLSTGLFAGKWASFAGAPDLPGDQQEEDGGALVFDTTTLTEDLELLGDVQVELELSSDRPVAMLAVRLSDVRPDRQTTRVTYGLLNLTHRDSHADPQPLVPGKRTRVAVTLNDVGQVFPAGHQLRLAISTSYWPLAWLPPEPTTLTIYPDACCLRLPVRPRRDEPEVRFDPPETAPPQEATTIEPRESWWRVTRDLGTNSSTLEVVKDGGVTHIEDIDLEIQHKAVEHYTVVGSDVSSARGETVWERGLARGDWSIRTVTRTSLTCDATAFHLHANLDAFEDERRVYSANWDRSIPRRLV
jgi:putative CocE/NonD family hydrolase